MQPLRDSKLKANAKLDSAIVLTTFSDRFFSHALPTLNAFREAGLTRRVFLVINGDQNRDTDALLRSKFLAEALQLYPVEPICFASGRGMAEMWNAGARYSYANKIIFLNEDLIIQPSLLEEALSLIDAALDSSGLVVLNQSFGHFGVTRDALIKCGWFDERFLGFGEEDGDFAWRFVQTFGRDPLQISHGAINNSASGSGYEHFASRKGMKYSLLNHLILQNIYEFSNGEGQGLFGTAARYVSRVERQYPYERFRDEAGELLMVQSEEEVRTRLKSIFDSLGRAPEQ